MDFKIFVALDGAEDGAYELVKINGKSIFLKDKDDFSFVMAP